MEGSDLGENVVRSVLETFLLDIDLPRHWARAFVRLIRAEQGRHRLLEFGELVWRAPDMDFHAVERPLAVGRVMHQSPL